mmetsp:Transcript_4105/g.15847  ORF Transcript_4105/g.15847 Transcript_4105/m.15847 type:complete len:379 (-) Transcript_4105:287-1423(-)
MVFHGRLPHDSDASFMQSRCQHPSSGIGLHQEHVIQNGIICGFGRGLRDAGRGVQARHVAAGYSRLRVLRMAQGWNCFLSSPRQADHAVPLGPVSPARRPGGAARVVMAPDAQVGLQSVKSESNPSKVAPLVDRLTERDWQLPRQGRARNIFRSQVWPVAGPEGICSPSQQACQRLQGHRRLAPLKAPRQVCQVEESVARRIAPFATHAKSNLVAFICFLVPIRSVQGLEHRRPRHLLERQGLRCSRLPKLDFSLFVVSEVSPFDPLLRPHRPLVGFFLRRRTCSSRSLGHQLLPAFAGVSLPEERHHFWRQRVLDLFHRISNLLAGHGGDLVGVLLVNGAVFHQSHHRRRRIFFLSLFSTLHKARLLAVVALPPEIP